MAPISGFFAANLLNDTFCRPMQVFARAGKSMILIVAELWISSEDGCTLIASVRSPLPS